MSQRSRRLLRGTGIVCALALAGTLTACGGSDDSGSGPDKLSASDVEAALEKGGTVTVWAWEPTLKQVAADFQKEHPKVKVKLVNAGTGNDQYKALQNAIAAKKGVPDVAQVEYYAMGQYALTKELTDLKKFGADKLADQYSPGPWNGIKAGGDGLYGLPMDSGPMALFYNKKVFDKHGIKVPTTWDEYVAAARALHKADPKAYITNDTGDAGFTTSMLWQAGSRPYEVDGTKVHIDFSDAGASKYTSTWQKLLDDKLVAPVTSWSDEWYKGLGDGTIATLAIGAWMPANLASGVKDAAGDWRVAPLPQWSAGDKASAENGGSALALPELGEHEALAYAFIEYANAGKGVDTRVKGGAFPATTAQLESASFQNTAFPYFGGQQANKIFAQSAAAVPDDWSYLPYQVYANSIFNDTAGKAYVSGTTLAEGLKAWQDASVKYGDEQGFTVEK
ncbi:MULTISPECIES: sugar ABC transporter substrate-binding protein [unclassified Streptomyces]|uniref:ABC transporter substrate-binding protein n=1 Tax=unclassified Streptomyces TaxID=2593676 RepID=UPI002E2A9CA2|nr:sugar ABC transporter substrate-binding protein [Streptomyces sp. NBC_01423]WSX89843.1 sugar ABC transporter substrate-binding protein [Streptomyces sp. NBC_00891]WSY04323.1 sugar ABC transporter substrate-binding protein [Streptomyces sp. NBC_00890]WSZ05948.1 sugar ABC transporter substrate-binding protein [Streptomyces sp. NBC_00869]WSZ26556.1 sugar ABC transporter substrate-binding protein [Streptomyces sp. NBC_00870]